MSILAPTESREVTDAQMQRYTDLIYRTTGIRIPLQKKTLLSNRVRRRMRSLGVVDFDAYFQFLSGLLPQDAEWDAFLQEVTTHETYLFRDEQQWQWFREEYLTEVLQAANQRRGPKSLRIWSAACSTGDEPYTIASCVAATLPMTKDWKVQIVGTDIGVSALAAARAGVFGARSMQLVSQDYKQRFFDQTPGAEQWKAKKSLSDLLTFKAHNLMKPLAERPFDVVFLKNVLIYFDAASKRTVLNHLRRVLRPGGLLVAGPAEGVNDLLKDFTRLRSWLYAWPEQTVGAK